MVIVNIKKKIRKKAFKKEAVFKVPKIKGYPMIRIEKGCDFQRNTNFSYSSQPLQIILSYQGSFNRGKINGFLHFKILESMVFMRIIEN